MKNKVDLLKQKKLTEYIGKNYNYLNESKNSDGIIELLNEEFLVPIRTSRIIASGETVIKENEEISLVHLSDKENNYIPLFSDYSQTKDIWESSALSYTKLSLKKSIELMNSSVDLIGVVINPFTHNLVIVSNSNNRKNIIPKNTTVKVGVPEWIPPGLIQNLKRVLNHLRKLSVLI